MQSGKSTLADALVDSGYTRLSLAAALKEFAAMAYGPVGKSTEYEVVDLVSGEKNKISGRVVLQRLGQSVKVMDRDFWIKILLNNAKMYLDTPLVVDDMRFPYEEDAFRAADWLIVGVNASTAERMRRAEALTGREPTSEELSHDSEKFVPGIIERADVIVQGERDVYENVKLILEEASR